MKLKEKVFAFFILFILCAGVTIGTIIETYGDIITNLTTTLTAVVSVGAVYLQMKKDAKITQAGFLLEFSKLFYSYEGAEILEQKIDRKAEQGEMYVYTTDDYELINDYFLWLEALAAMIENKTLDIEFINELYNYRFFSVTNNPSIQKNELCRFAQYYSSIFFLHKEWVSYRKKHGQPIMYEEYDLAKNPVYDKILSGRC